MATRYDSLTPEQVNEVYEIPFKVMGKMTVVQNCTFLIRAISEGMKADKSPHEIACDSYDEICNYNIGNLTDVQDQSIKNIALFTQGAIEEKLNELLSIAPVDPEDPVETESIVVRNSTGGAESTFNADTLTFGGTIAYYLANSSSEGNPPTDGNYVGVTITAPEGVTVDQDKATFTYTNQAGTETTLVNGDTEWLDGENYVNYYPKVTAERKEFTVVIDWDGEGTAYAPEAITITVADATLAPAPVDPEDPEEP